MRVTLRDIAKRVNLSHATVSFVLNERMDVSIPPSTRERVLEAAKEMGYRPNRAAQALVRGRTNMVALWIPSQEAADNAPALEALSSLAAADGFELVTRLWNFGREGASPAWVVDDWPVDGVLLLDCHRDGGYFAPSSDVPVVSLGSLFHADRDHVGVDFRAGTTAAMDHLAQSGCERIAYLTANTSDHIGPKRAAYLSECQARGLKPEVISVQRGDRAKLVSSLDTYISAHGAPDAIIAQTDDLAISIRRALADRGLSVPNDVMIVGHGGSEPGAYSMPSLTSIVQPTSEMCGHAWSILNDRIGRSRSESTTHDQVHSTILASTLCIRESTVRA